MDYLEEIYSLIEPLDGIVLIDPDDGLDCWNRDSPSYWVYRGLDGVASRLNIPIFMRKACLDGTEQGRLTMMDYFQGPHPWIPIVRFDDQEDAAIISKHIPKPREEIYLGFGGTLSESCVKQKLLNLCWHAEIPGVRRDYEIPWKPERIDEPFGKGILLYELTENVHIGFSQRLSLDNLL